jgi:epoxyqueuosine reductase
MIVYVIKTAQHQFARLPSTRLLLDGLCAMMRAMELKQALKQSARAVGFDVVGIAPATPGRDLEFARQWVERGYAGEMRYLANPRRDDARRILPSASSVICVGLLYNTPYPYSSELDRTGVGSQESEVRRQASVVSGQSPVAGLNGQRTTDDGRARADAHAWISRYAWGQDYHEIVRAKLEKLRVAVEELAPGVEARAFVDTGPIVERAFARFSGLGWMGKNTCIINEAKGSWLFLGAMLTGLELEPDVPAPDRCGSCTACLEACPTGALVEPYVMDARRCISYLSIELKGSIPEQFRSAIGANVFGCDICQDVCPWNSGQSSGVSRQSPKSRSQEDRFEPSFVNRQSPIANRQSPAPSTEHLAPSTFSLFNPPLEALASLTEEDFKRIFPRSPIKRVKYRGWLRNLCVAMGNSGNQKFAPWLERAREHSDPIIREHAEWALKQLQIWREEPPH